MANEVTGIANVRTKTKGDIAAKLVDTAGVNELSITGTGHIPTDLNAGDGTALNHTAGKLHIDIQAQGLGGVKLSRDGGAPTTSNANYAEIVTNNAVIDETNPLAVRLVDPSDPVGTAQSSAALSALLGASGGFADIVEYAPPNAEVFTLLEVTVSAADYAHFQVFLGATLIDTIFVGVGYTTHTKSYKTQAKSLTGNGTLKFRVEGTNDSHQQQKLAVSYEGTKV